MLRAFLRGAAGQRCALGTHDCGLFVADWVEYVRGVDPAAEVRGRYATDDALMRLAGPLGLPRLFDRLLTGAGLRRTEDPELGDVALLAAADMPVRGAIRTRHGFVMVGEHGISGLRGHVRLVLAWALMP